MSRKVWLALALAAVVAVGFSAVAVAARHKASTDPRPKTVTKGLDYFHARQLKDGGFGTMASTAWVILGAVASGERMGSPMWTVGGNNPFDFLQAHSHEAAASGPDVDNAPVYYARAILSYVAVGQLERVFVAGTPRVDLLSKLYSYQDLVDGSATKGSFSPSTSSRKFQAVHTTAWAILAMHAMNEDDKDRFGFAETWLATQQQADGGFAAQAGDASNCEDTAVAIQALLLAPTGTVDAAILPAARQFLKTNQRADGGFPYKPGTGTDAWATAAAIQAIVALGEDPNSADWKAGVNTPTDALGNLQLASGAYDKKRDDHTGPLPTTAWALIALRDKPFTTYPKKIPPALKAFVFRPKMLTVSPKDNAKYATHVVLIKATYTDGTKGTGVKPKACRVYVDNVNHTKPAVIGTHALHLQLNNVPDGAHTWRLEIVDNAGNVKVTERRFTIATPVPTPTYMPTPQPTWVPAPTIYPTPTPTTPSPYPTLTPTETPSVEPTTTPNPFESGLPVTGSPVASPEATSTTGTAGGGGGSGGTGSAAGFLGGTLLAMLPIGAAISYFVIQRRERALSGAGEGKTLPGGGSAWERFKSALARSKDLVKPAGR